MPGVPLSHHRTGDLIRAKMPPVLVAWSTTQINLIVNRVAEE